MGSFIPLFNTLLALGIIGLQIIIVVLWLLVLSKKGDLILAFFAKQAFLFSFIIALGSTLVSLYYSLIIGFTPCDLCWYQRIFMYPLVILFGIALWKKDNGVIKYGLALSSVGAIIAFYNSYLQYGGSPLLPCGIDVNAVSCGVRYIFEFGYVTLPLMSLTGFVFIVTILFLRHRQK